MLLAATGVSLYLLAPSLLEVFSSWPQLKTLKPEWVALALVFEAASFVAFWEVQRIALRTPSWFIVGTTQLAGNAFGSIVPGGGAAASALSYRMLVRAGVPADTVASGITASWLATTSAMLALPVLAIPAVLGGLTTPNGLLQTAYIGIAAFVLVLLVGTAVFVWDAPLQYVGRAVQWLFSRTRKRDSFATLPDRLLQQRDAVREALGAHWPMAVAASVGKWGFDYVALICCLAAVGARPEPALVLLAYAWSSLLKLIPITPGGLGFVEAGLTGLLALAGVGGREALVATLAYRLVGFWLPLPIGGVAALLFRRRYGSVPAPPVSSTSPP